MLVARVALQVDVAVEDEEAAVPGLPERIDLGERQIVAEEDLDQRGDDGRQAVQVLAAHPDGGDRLLCLVGREREERGDVDLAHVLGVLLGDLLDVDAAHVAEDEDGELPPPVPGDRGEVLAGDERALLDQHAARLLPPDLEREDRARGGLGLRRRVGELDAAGLHAPAGQHLGLEDDRDGEVPGDLCGLGGATRDAALQERRAVAGEEGFGFVFVETHGRNTKKREAANTLRRRGSRDDGG